MENLVTEQWRVHKAIDYLDTLGIYLIKPIVLACDDRRISLQSIITWESWKSMVIRLNKHVGFALASGSSVPWRLEYLANNGNGSLEFSYAGGQEFIVTFYADLQHFNRVVPPQRTPWCSSALKVHRVI